MATKKTVPVATIVLTEPYQLCVRYAPETLIPCCAVDARWMRLTPRTQIDGEMRNAAKFVTSDGHLVKMEIVAAMNNSDGRYDVYFDEICQRLFNMPYATIKSVWKSRFPRMDGYWYLIKLNKV